MTDAIQTTADNLSAWRGVERPKRVVHDGRYARLEPLDPVRHGDALFASATQPNAGERFRYLFEEPPEDRTQFDGWLAKVAEGEDPMVFAVVDKASGRAEGRQSLMRIDPSNGVIEIGGILWGPAIARTRVATEALFLFARHVFGDLGYRRFEWKCNSLNAPSRQAAQRFGFTPEGVFRQHMVQKGENRDTAWFAMIDRDWPRLRAAYEAWLEPGNFDTAGTQKTKLKL